MDVRYAPQMANCRKFIIVSRSLTEELLFICFNVIMLLWSVHGGILQPMGRQIYEYLFNFYYL